MKDLRRTEISGSTQLLMRILEQPGLVAAVRHLPGAALGRLIDRIGLEDAGELVALATTAQLERVFDDDLWRADRAAGDETFRPERFVLWLRIMSEAGDDALVQRLCELPQDLVALAVQRLVLVVNIDVVDGLLSPEDDEAQSLEKALDNAIVEEWEEFQIIARDADAWDDVWGALVALDRDHHHKLRALLQQCCDITMEYISGQGTLYEVLTANEMLDNDVASAREDRRAAEGFISAADARAFLELARRHSVEEERDAITRAYFRGLQPAATSFAVAHSSEGGSTARADLARELTALLQEADMAAPNAPPAAALPALGVPSEYLTHLVAPVFEQAMKDLRESDPALFQTRASEVGYLVNVWIMGGTDGGRRPQPHEAMETVLSTCEAGIRARLGNEVITRRAACAVLKATPADLLFRLGFR